MGGEAFFQRLWSMRLRNSVRTPKTRSLDMRKSITEWILFQRLKLVFTLEVLGCAFNSRSGPSLVALAG